MKLISSWFLPSEQRLAWKWNSLAPFFSELKGKMKSLSFSNLEYRVLISSSGILRKRLNSAVFEPLSSERRILACFPYTFSWFESYRRLSKDYEYQIETSETMIQLVMIRLMLNRIKK